MAQNAQLGTASVLIGVRPAFAQSGSCARCLWSSCRADDTPTAPDAAGFPGDGNRTALLSAQGMPGTWQESECLHVAGPDDREVPVVKRGDLGQPKALGDGRHGGIDDTERKIKIRFHEFGHAADIGVLEFGDLEPVTPERPKEGHLSLRSHPRLEEVPDLAQDWRTRAMPRPGCRSRELFCPARWAIATRPSPTGWHSCRFPLVRRHRTRNGAGKTTMMRVILGLNAAC